MQSRTLNAVPCRAVRFVQGRTISAVPSTQGRLLKGRTKQGRTTKIVLIVFDPKQTFSYDHH